MIVLLLVALLGASQVSAEPLTGPIVKEFGPVYFVPEEPVSMAEGDALKAVFDIAGAPEETGDRNARLETVARFLNLNARAGVPAERMAVAIVLHGRATRAALDAGAYEERYGEKHPDEALLDALVGAGADVRVCGQSASALGFTRQDLRPDVVLSPSAMTALVQLQSAGYALIPWGAR